MVKKVWAVSLVLVLGVGLGLQTYSASAASKYKGMCPTYNFPDLSQSVGAGNGYAKPYLYIACTTTEVIVTSNGMPSFPFVKMTPNSLKAQSWVWRIPLVPKVASKTTSIKNVLGTLGLTVSGLPIYGPTEGPQPASEAYGDPVYNKIVDSCGGHTGPASEYHQHAITLLAACNLSQQTIVGYALDGFPIYTNVGCTDTDCSDTVKLVSGYTLTGNPKTNSWDAYTYVKSDKANVLDECNGRVEPDGTYGYHITNTFPYVIGCFRGTPTVQEGKTGAPMPLMAPEKKTDSMSTFSAKKTDNTVTRKKSATPTPTPSPKPTKKKP
ncbi:MAG: YHYH protein [Actinomycetota bacterium]